MKCVTRFCRGNFLLFFCRVYLQVWRIDRTDHGLLLLLRSLSLPLPLHLRPGERLRLLLFRALPNSLLSRAAASLLVHLSLPLPRRFAVCRPLGVTSRMPGSLSLSLSEPKDGALKVSPAPFRPGFALAVCGIRGVFANGVCIGVRKKLPIIGTPMAFRSVAWRAGFAKLLGAGVANGAAVVRDCIWIMGGVRLSTGCSPMGVSGGVGRDGNAASVGENPAARRDLTASGVPEGGWNSCRCSGSPARELPVRFLTTVLGAAGAAFTAVRGGLLSDGPGLVLVSRGLALLSVGWLFLTVRGGLLFLLVDCSFLTVRGLLFE